METRKMTKRIDDELAEKTLRMLKKCARADRASGGEPVAAVIVDINPFIEISKFSMNGAMGICSQLCWRKAYTALMTQRDTKEWANWQQEKGKHIENFCDPNFTAFAGGVLIRDPETNEILGAIGVSGRSGYKTKKDQPRQDHELAQLGAEYLQHMLKRQKTAH